MITKTRSFLAIDVNVSVSPLPASWLLALPVCSSLHTALSFSVDRQRNAAWKLLSTQIYINFIDVRQGQGSGLWWWKGKGMSKSEWMWCVMSHLSTMAVFKCPSWSWVCPKQQRTFSPKNIMDALRLKWLLADDRHKQIKDHWRELNDEAESGRYVHRYCKELKFWS